MNILATLLHALGNIAESQDCDRPSEALEILMSQSQYDNSEIESLHRELDTMKTVIGDLSIQIDEMKHKRNKVPEEETQIIPIYEAKK